MEIYQYDDYRAFLRDRYEEFCSSRGGLTCRQFAALAGFSNPGYFNDVVKARRHLSDGAAKSLVALFELDERQAEFFRLLLSFSRLRDSKEKAELYSRILFRRNRSTFSRLDPAKSRYYQDPRYPLIRAAIEAGGFRGDYQRLADSIDPPLPASVVRKCVRDLCEWGLVAQSMDGRYHVTEKFVEPSATQGELIRRLNRFWITDGASAIDRFGPDKRHVSTMLLNVSQATAAEVRSRIEKFREDLFALLKADKKPECVMQFSMLYFPRVRPKKERQGP